MCLMAWGAAPLAAVSHGRVEAVNLPLMSVVPALVPFCPMVRVPVTESQVQ